MEGTKMDPFYATILGSSSSNFLQPRSNISPNQDLGSITNPPPPHVQREEVNKNLNSIFGHDKKKATWYKGPWTSREDSKLISLVERFGTRKWSSVAMYIPGRIGKQCRERWHNNLRPTIEKNVVWSDEEEKLIIKGHMRFGNSWSAISKLIPGRSENDVKNHWNSLKRKQLATKKIKRAARLRGFYQSNILENYIKRLFFNPAATATPPPPTTAVAPPPITTLPDTTPIVAPPTIVPAIAQPPPAALNTDKALIPSDDTIPPLSVDDYEVDGVPYFTFEIADLMQSLYVDEDNANDDDADANAYADDGASTSYLAADTVEEEISFMRSIFGNNNIGGV